MFSMESCRTRWFFFFQAEDGIRALYVTGVQTCALPISRPGGAHRARGARRGLSPSGRQSTGGAEQPAIAPAPSRVTMPLLTWWPRNDAVTIGGTRAGIYLAISVARDSRTTVTRI